MELEGFVAEMGNERNVTFARFQRDGENWLPAIDAFVLPSLTGGPLWRSSRRCPLVSSAVGGIPQVIESEKNGILIAHESPEEIKKGHY